MPRKLLLPTFRRSTFRAPDPDAAARFDASLPGANADVEGRPAGELAELAELRTESIETALAEQRRLVEERLVAELAADRDALTRLDPNARPEQRGPGKARTSFVADASNEGAHRPRHRADRIGNRRPTSGRRRPLVAG